MTKKEQLEKLNRKLSQYSNCALRKGCSNIVFGSGNPEAKILFVGEAPGKKEDELGIPFVGSSGRILDKALESIKLKREDIYITNICKCRPPENRDPFPEEIQTCWPWLEKQIKIIDPKIIVTLGRHALESFIPNAKISEMHGQILEINLPKIGKRKIFPIHHPAAARISKKVRAIFAQDFKTISKLIQNKKEH
jgi:DNA polymerase